jgi:hypothetical protein
MNDPALADDEIRKAIAGSSAAAARVQVVGEIETFEAVMGFHVALTGAVSRMWTKRWGVLALKGRLDGVDQQIQWQVDEHKRLIERQKQLVLQVSQDPQELPKVVKLAESVSDRVNNLMQQRNGLQQELSAAVMSATEAGLAEAPALADAARPLLARVRAELGLSESEARIGEVQEATRQRLGLILERLITAAKQRAPDANPTQGDP